MSFINGDSIELMLLDPSEDPIVLDKVVCNKCPRARFGQLELLAFARALVNDKRLGLVLGLKFSTPCKKVVATAYDKLTVVCRTYPYEGLARTRG
jgi:hypothetical protein